MNRGGQICLPKTTDSEQPTARVSLAKSTRPSSLDEKLQLLQLSFPRMTVSLIEEVLCSHALDLVRSVKELSFLDTGAGECSTEDSSYDLVTDFVPVTEFEQSAEWIVSGEEWEMIDDVGNQIQSYSDIVKACADKHVSEKLSARAPVSLSTLATKGHNHRTRSKVMVIQEPGYYEQKALGQRRVWQSKKYKIALRLAREKKKNTQQ